MNELEEYKKRIASAGGQAYREKYKGTDKAKEISRKGVEARLAKRKKEQGE